MSNLSYKKISEKNHKVVFIVGTTASGKSDLALKLAHRYDGVIVNCDSVQVYQGLEIGSAQPSREDKSVCPHYLYSYVPVGSEITAGQFCRDFYEVLKSLPPEKKVFVVGGTGFYFQAIEKGMYPVRQVNIDLKNQIEEILQTAAGAQELYKELQKKDPEAASKISLNDHYRIGRAIELIRSEGKTMTEIKNQFASEQEPFPFPLLKLGIAWSRDELNRRILMRTKRMIENGLIEETKGILKLLADSGQAELPLWAPLSSVGYKETVHFIQQEKRSILDLSNEISQSTLRLAKKQKTWFKRDLDIHWLDGEDLASEEKAMERVTAFMKVDI